MSDPRRFLTVAIASGLDFGVMSPDDVIRHVSMEVLAHHLPVPLKARLLTAALEADAMTATLVLDTLGVEAIVENVPLHIMWACVAESAKQSLDQGATLKPPPPPPSVESRGERALRTRKTRATNRKPNRSAAATTLRPSIDSRLDTEGAESDFDEDTSVGNEPPVSVDATDEVTAFGEGH